MSDSCPVKVGIKGYQISCARGRLEEERDALRIDLIRVNEELEHTRAKLMWLWDAVKAIEPAYRDMETGAPYGPDCDHLITVMEEIEAITHSAQIEGGERESGG